MKSEMLDFDMNMKIFKELFVTHEKSQYFFRKSFFAKG